MTIVTRCAAQTASGKACKMPALRGHEFCYNHEPSNARKAAKSRKRGGERQRTPHVGDPFTLPETFGTVQDANKILDYTLAEVLPMENSIARARVLLAIHESFLRAIEIGELESRIAALEARK